MNTMKIAAAAAGLFLSAGMGIPAAWGADGPPANLKPATVYGVGLNVTDLEGQRAWYAAKLGMTLLATNRAADGSPNLYIMGYVDGPGTAIVALQKRLADQPQPNASSRIILIVPNAKGLADWLKTQGIDNLEVVANTNYSITDPEGNAIVLLHTRTETVTAAPISSAPCGSGPTRSRLLDGALRVMRDGNRYESARGQDMYTQGLAQQGIFDEEYAKCLRSNPAPSR